jgi:hypothetical protein
MLEKFGKNLTELLSDIDGRDENIFSLYVGCGPDGNLGMCAKEAGIDENRFPWKTGMTFKNGGVQVKCGYGAAYEEI